jgi:septum formation protein
MTAPPPSQVVLASTSASRMALLSAAGVTFEAVAPGVDEDAAKAALLGEGLSPRDIADALAELKAVRVSRRPGALVIGADQTLDLDGRLMDKAASLDEARERLQALRGRVHKLHAGVVVARDGQPIWREVQSATLRMRAFSDAFLDRYLERQGQAVLSSVGCYHLEGEGVQLFDRIDGDYFAILGLPLLGLLDLLRRHGALPL